MYLVDPETGNMFMLAKSMGKGWYVRDHSGCDKTFEERFDEWLEENEDKKSSYGNCYEMEPTRYILITENDPKYMDLWRSCQERKKEIKNE